MHSYGDIIHVAGHQLAPDTVVIQIAYDYAVCIEEVTSVNVNETVFRRLARQNVLALRQEIVQNSFIIVLPSANVLRPIDVTQVWL